MSFPTVIHSIVTNWQYQLLYEFRQMAGLDLVRHEFRQMAGLDLVLHEFRQMVVLDPARTNPSKTEKYQMTMLTMDARPATSFEYRTPADNRSGLHRLFAAAIVNSQFREKLLCEPESALANGYLGQTFSLTDQENAIVRTIRAKDLTDFAKKVNQALKAS
jgi:hypothetical protein